MLSDILDGYFPYDLKKEYPEGVMLLPVDFTDDTYSEELFKDKSDPKYKDLQSVLSKNAKPLSKQEFLDKFPKNVVSSGGEVIPVREELEKKF